MSSRMTPYSARTSRKESSQCFKFRQKPEREWRYMYYMFNEICHMSPIARDQARKLVSSDVAWDASGTEIDPCIWHILS